MGDIHTDPWGDYTMQHNMFPMQCSTWMVVESGYFAHENPEIHRLSQTLLYLVSLNAVIIPIAYLILLVAVIFDTDRSPYFVIADLIIATAFASFVWLASVKAIHTRNQPLCCLTWMGALLLVYAVVLIYIVGAFFFILDIVLTENSHHFDLVLTVVWGIGTSVCAEYARRLYKILPSSDPSSEQRSKVRHSRKMEEGLVHQRHNATVIIEEENGRVVSSLSNETKSP